MDHRSALGQSEQYLPNHNLYDELFRGFVWAKGVFRHGNNHRTTPVITKYHSDRLQSANIYPLIMPTRITRDSRYLSHPTLNDTLLLPSSAHLSREIELLVEFLPVCQTNGRLEP